MPPLSVVDVPPSSPLSPPSSSSDGTNGTNGTRTGIGGQGGQGGPGGSGGSKKRGGRGGGGFDEGRSLRLAGGVEISSDGKMVRMEDEGGKDKEDEDEEVRNLLAGLGELQRTHMLMKSIGFIRQYGFIGEV